MYTGGDGLFNRPFSQLSDLRDLDLGSGHTAYRCIALIDLYLYSLNRRSRPEN